MSYFATIKKYLFHWDAFMLVYFWLVIVPFFYFDRNNSVRGIDGLIFFVLNASFVVDSTYKLLTLRDSEQASIAEKLSQRKPWVMLQVIMLLVQGFLLLNVLSIPAKVVYGLLAATAVPSVYALFRMYKLSMIDTK
jgi:hypothetical protein